MSSIDQHGSSIYTQYKQQSLRSFLLVQMAITKAIFNKPTFQGGWHDHTYLYIGLHGGQGKDPKTGQDGSPLIFHDVAKNSGVLYRGEIYEKNPASFLELEYNTSGLPNMNVHNADHHALFDKLPAKPFKWQYGAIYCDPTGVSIPEDLLKFLVSSYPAMEIIINIAATNYKRVRSVHKGKLLSEVLYGLKPNWLIRKPISGKQWTLLVGTKWNNEWGAKGFVDINTSIGGAWFEKIVYSVDERRQQMQLPLFDNTKALDIEKPYRNYPEYLRHPKFRAIRKQAMDAAEWTCQNCGARATEVHHLRYPKWGTFDIIDNLLPVCHQCHCDIHGKAD